jgi:hypothetical protein
VEPSVEVDLVVRPLLLGLHAYMRAVRFVRVSARMHLLGKIKADCPDSISLRSPQCKNTRSVDIGVLAKEVGMATLLQAQVVVIATTGSFTGPAFTYADRVNETTQFQVILVTADILEAYRSGGALALRQCFREKTREAMHLKRAQVMDTLDGLSEDES